MPRYYFHLTDGKQVLNNHKGIDLPGNAAAREDAVALARDLEHGVVMPGWNWTGWFVTIVDEHGKRVDEVPIADVWVLAEREAPVLVTRAAILDYQFFRVRIAINAKRAGWLKRLYARLRTRYQKRLRLSWFLKSGVPVGCSQHATASRVYWSGSWMRARNAPFCDGQHSAHSRFI
jgi:hypothetical protein